MANVRVIVAVHGFTESEVRAGLPDLLEEFEPRHWILHPKAAWDAGRKCLSIGVEYDVDDIEGCKLAAQDEVWDCVIACFHFSSQISFVIEHAGYVPEA